MARKPRVKKEDVVVKKEEVAKVEVATEAKPGPEVAVEEAKKEEVVAEVKAPAKKKEEKVEWKSNLPESLGRCVDDYAKSVGPEKAVKLAQRMLGIGETGVVTDDLVSAYNQSYGKHSFLDQYDSAREDGGNAHVKDKAKGKL